VFPGGTESIMADRGPTRIVNPNETTTFDIQGNGWRFPAGHRIRVELSQNDAPYVKASTTPSSLTITGATLRMPVREPSETIAASVP
jgi:predicted acyl esterase